MKEISETMARKCLEEYNTVQQTDFWELLMEEYEEEKNRAIENWKLTEIGNLNQSLLEKWIRCQVRAKTFEDVQAIPLEIEKKLKKIIEK